MNACHECLMRSLIQNDAAGFAENSAMSPARARRLINQGDQASLEMLRRELPEVESRLGLTVEALAGGGAHDVWACCSHDPDFPDQMKQLHDPPKVLYGLGSQQIIVDLREPHPGVAIVGARRASAYGREVAYQFGRDLAAAGITVVSGMAIGVDGAAHRGALDAGGRTVAVLAGGVDRPYPPSHRRLYEQIVAAGAVVSERPPGARARRWGFPARNRLVAALSRRTVYVEGTLSSGARYTVEFAEQIGQDPLAVPGPITSPLSDGPNAIIAEPNGSAVISAEGVLNHVFDFDFGSRLTVENAERVRRDDELSAGSQTVLGWIRAGESTAQAIQASTPELTAREISIALGELELAGWIQRDPSGAYRTIGSGVAG